MEILHIQGTSNTPSVTLNHTSHKLQFSGESRPENVREFFAPVYNWLNDYKNVVFYLAEQSQTGINITVEFKMEYFNSSSVRVFNEILTELKKFVTESNNKVRLTINWHYDEGDIDNKEAGEEFADLIKLPINIIEGF